MEPTESPKINSEPRMIVISNDHFGFAKMEAWVNIIRSYQAKHPGHHVHLSYEGEEIRNLKYMFKIKRPVNPTGFQCYISTEDRDLKDFSKLVRLLVEGAGPNHGSFLTRELNRVLDLF
ncbi:MAG: hypothetical protein V3S64_01295 [bacterium]